jgi:hypothetical protein
LGIILPCILLVLLALYGALNVGVSVQKPYYQSPLSSIDVASGKDKTIKIFLAPSYEFTSKKGSELISNYSEYDKIVFIENKKN